MQNDKDVRCVGIDSMIAGSEVLTDKARQLK
jgi:hypothetical protein